MKDFAIGQTGEMKRMVVVIKFRNGFDLRVECTEFSVQTDSLTGSISSYSIKGITRNRPVYIDLNDVLCIYREGD